VGQRHRQKAPAAGGTPGGDHGFDPIGGAAVAGAGMPPALGGVPTVTPDSVHQFLWP
jgi:hypothetical protein